MLKKKKMPLTLGNLKSRKVDIFKFKQEKISHRNLIFLYLRIFSYCREEDASFEQKKSHLSAKFTHTGLKESRSFCHNILKQMINRLMN